jgi:hypothetical protein
MTTAVLSRAGETVVFYYFIGRGGEIRTHDPLRPS